MRHPGKRIETHNRACVEAMWTPEQALAVPVAALARPALARRGRAGGG